MSEGDGMTEIERWRIRNVGNGPLIAEPVGFGRHHHPPVLGSGFEVVPSDAYQGAVEAIAAHRAAIESIGTVSVANDESRARAQAKHEADLVLWRFGEQEAG